MPSTFTSIHMQLLIKMYLMHEQLLDPVDRLVIHHGGQRRLWMVTNHGANLWMSLIKLRAPSQLWINAICGLSFHTQLNPRWREPLDGMMGFFHGPRLITLATPHNGALWRVPIFSWLHTTYLKLVGTTSYPLRVEMTPFKAKIQFSTCVCKSIRFTIAKWLLVAGKLLLLLLLYQSLVGRLQLVCFVL